MNNKLLLIVIIFLFNNSVLAFDLCVDPGHGGSVPGALTHIENYTEANINLQVALALKDTLEQNGFLTNIDVIYTRLSDSVYVPNPDRANFANSIVMMQNILSQFTIVQVITLQQFKGLKHGMEQKKLLNLLLVLTLLHGMDIQETILIL